MIGIGKRNIGNEKNKDNLRRKIKKKNDEMKVKMKELSM